MSTLPTIDEISLFLQTWHVTLYITFNCAIAPTFMFQPFWSIICHCDLSGSNYMNWERRLWPSQIIRSGSGKIKLALGLKDLDMCLLEDKSTVSYVGSSRSRFEKWERSNCLNTMMMELFQKPSVVLFAVAILLQNFLMRLGRNIKSPIRISQLIFLIVFQIPDMIMQEV